MLKIDGLVMITCALFGYLLDHIRAHEDISESVYDSILDDLTMDFWDVTDDENKNYYSQLTNAEKVQFLETVYLMVRYNIRPEE